MKLTEEMKAEIMKKAWELVKLSERDDWTPHDEIEVLIEIKEKDLIITK